MISELRVMRKEVRAWYVLQSTLRPYITPLVHLCIEFSSHMEINNVRVTS